MMVNDDDHDDEDGDHDDHDDHDDEDGDDDAEEEVGLHHPDWLVYLETDGTVTQ